MAHNKYVWRADEVLELRKQGIELVARLDLMNTVQLARRAGHDELVVKSLATDSNELEVLRIMLSLSSPRNHVVPCQLLACGSTTLAIMPALRALEGLHRDTFTVDEVLDITGQFIEALDFMHDRNMAFGDVALENSIRWQPGTLTQFGSWQISPDRIYLIDFGCSRLFPKGPGDGMAIHDWFAFGGHFEPPEGRDQVDPYAYDVYCVGQQIFEFCEDGINYYSFHPPRSLISFLDSMRSCDPSRRPSMRRANQLFPALKAWIFNTRWIYRRLPGSLADTIDYYGWKLRSIFV